MMKVFTVIKPFSLLSGTLADFVLYTFCPITLSGETRQMSVEDTWMQPLVGDVYYVDFMPYLFPEKFSFSLLSSGRVSPSSVSICRNMWTLRFYEEYEKVRYTDTESNESYTEDLNK